MRANQLSHHSAKLRLVTVPVRCRCIAPVAAEPYVHRSDKLLVRVNGLLAQDAVIEVINYTADRHHVVVEFAACIPVYAHGLSDGVERARLISVEFSGWVEGEARDVSVSIIGEVLLSNPGGKVFSLVGADR